MRGWALYIIQGVENRRDLLELYRYSMIHCRFKAGTAPALVNSLCADVYW